MKTGQKPVDQHCAVHFGLADRHCAGLSHRALGGGIEHTRRGKYSGQPGLHHPRSHFGLAWHPLGTAAGGNHQTKPRPCGLARLGVLFLTVLVSFFGLFQLASLAMRPGTAWQSPLGLVWLPGQLPLPGWGYCRHHHPRVGRFGGRRSIEQFYGATGTAGSEKLPPQRRQDSST